MSWSEIIRFLKRKINVKRKDIKMGINETFINKYIPSSDVRKCMEEKSFIVSDWDMAAIIWNSNKQLKIKHEDIKLIADETEDTMLKNQIMERLAYDNEAIKRFDNNEGFVFSLNSHEYKGEDDIIGYFSCSDMAYKEGVKLGFDFGITKHKIVSTENDKIKTWGIVSPLIEPEESNQIVEGEDYSRIAEIEYDKNGEILSFWSCELQKEQDIKVNTLSNKRFENKFVAFPKVFNNNEMVKIVGLNSNIIKDNIGWIGKTNLDYDEFINRATLEDAIEDYVDSSLPVIFWDEDNLMWNHEHINPIYLEKVDVKYNNSFDEDKKIIVGHDCGAAVWIKSVKVENTDKITNADVTEIGMEISVEKSFFDEFLKALFIERFDTELPQNKNRYTYAFDKNGRYLNSFEEEILEHNFFTYNQINEILDKIGSLDIDISHSGFESDIINTLIQLQTFVVHVRRIMVENYETDFISVMS